MTDGLDTVEVTSAKAWRASLADHHTTSPGVWVTTWKKGRGPYVPYDALVDEAIAHGWVDSRPRALDGGKRIAETTGQAALGVRANQWRQPSS